MTVTTSPWRSILRSFVVLACLAAFMVVGLAAANASDDVGLVDRETGLWYLRDADTGETTSFYYGNPADIPFVGDWDCDGIATPGLYRQSDGFVYLRNTNTQGVADVLFFFGDPNDIPIAGDFDGDGCDTVSIYRSSESRVYIINEIGADGKGLGSAEFFYDFGNPGDVPVVGDPDGDGVDTVHMFRPSTNRLYLNNALAHGSNGVITVPDRTAPLIGDWPGADPVATFGSNPAEFIVPGTGTFEYGSPDMAPVASDFGALPGGDPPPPVPPPYPDVGSGKRIIYSNSQQHVWLIDENDKLVDDYAVSGRKGIPLNGTYAVYSKSVNAWAPYGGITMKHMVRFVRPGSWGNRWAYGFHSIPRYPDGRPMQTEEQMGTFRSGGCVRQPDHKAEALFAWAEIGTVVHAIP
ncbi:MAG: L,D-transpeptidase [Acidimicrobiia bacterium]